MANSGEKGLKSSIYITIYARHFLVILFNHNNSRVKIIKTHFIQEAIKAHRSKITCPRSVRNIMQWDEEALQGGGREIHEGNAM